MYLVVELLFVECYFEVVGDMVEGYDIVSLMFVDLVMLWVCLSIEVVGDGKL